MSPQKSNESLSDMLNAVELGLTGVREGMLGGLQVDEDLISDLESRIERLQQMIASEEPHPINRQ